MIDIPQKKQRQFLPESFKVEAWEQVKPFFDELKNRQFNNVSELEKWLLDLSEVEAVLEEDMAWRYIRMNIDTNDKELSESFNFFVSEIQPNIAPYHHELNKKLIESPFIEMLDKEKYFIYLRSVKNEIEIFREENIPLFTKLQQEEQKYGAICAQMSVTIYGEEMTLPKAASLLKEPDRAIREEAYLKINQRRLEDKEKLDILFNELINLRTRIAKNAGFENYRDYKFAELGRFDYTLKDCLDFHESIESAIVPLINKIDLEKKQLLKVDEFKPWDNDVDPENKAALKPFKTGEELINKSIKCFNRVEPYFGQCLLIMKQMGYLDLESKKGKAPGGFNYPLYEIGVPFIYMNAVGSFRDMVTMVHEGGHAVHSFLSRDLEITAFKNVPSEVAELASMSMELISMEYWDEFFENEEDLKRAKREQLENVLEALPWIALIDKFQHWIYENTGHTIEERTQEWLSLHNTLAS
ncbi:MAG: M3 family oligoendopeptidase, partial [Bacteroidetes bacterium]|nr:M3 family oligoendopeptidase [Bacteroidota bacterium]